MCGIAGILTLDPEAPGRIDAPRLARMRDAIAHRGPDASGTWCASDRRAGLAHRRLAIVDLSDAGIQPMATEDDRYVLVYNGEIYNHVALRRELESLGHRFRSRTDSEVVLRAWAAWGERCLTKLSGMFAFAVLDRTSRELVLVRDRVGVKPVYFGSAGGEFRFASEIKGLLADPEMPREIEPVAAWHYLTFVVPPAPLTMFRGIYKLPAGHVLRIRPGREPHLEAWWSPGGTPAEPVDPAVYADEDAATAELSRRLERAITRRCMADVPVGVFLSGGVDSTTAVALMQRHLERPVDTFSVGFEVHERLNELDHARYVAERFGTRHHEIRVGERAMFDYLPRMVEEQDEPIADWVCVPLHFLSVAAREHGVPVVQVGEGADELFCGYESFRHVLATERRYARPLAAMPPGVRRGAVGVARWLGRRSERWRLRADVAERLAAGDAVFSGGAVALRDRDKEALWAGPRDRAEDLPAFVPAELRGFDSERVAHAMLSRLDGGRADVDFYARMLDLELRLRLPELLLMRVDKISMAQSIEARVPFLDPDVVEFAFGLPRSLLLRGETGKYLLRRAVRDIVPRQVLEREKMGFAAPFREWFRGPFGRWTEERLRASELDCVDLDATTALLARHRAGETDAAFPIWVVLNLVLWHDHWIRRVAA